MIIITIIIIITIRFLPVPSLAAGTKRGLCVFKLVQTGTGV